MRHQYKEIARHAGVYGLGLVLARLASIVLLPIHTRYLTPADYGVIAILDLTTAVLGTIGGGAFGTALMRYHYDVKTEEQQSAVWWTGITVVSVLAAVVIAPALVFRESLAALTIGPEEPRAGFYYIFTLATTLIGAPLQLPIFYFQVRRWSWLNVGFSLASLLLNIGLNTYLLAVAHWGILAVLTGNFVTILVMGLLRLAVVAHACGRYRFDRDLARRIVAFAGPITVTLLLALFMHQADRFILRHYVSLDQVGLYALAYSIGQGLNSLALSPFSLIWQVVIYDIAKDPHFKAAFARMFEYFFYVLILFLLGVAFYVKPLLAIVTTSAYAGAAPIVPIVLLSFVFFSMDDHIKVPAMLAKRTISLVPSNVAAVVTNIVLNVLLVPRYGVMAAAWASVATYFVLAAVNLWQNRRIDEYPYALTRCAGSLVAVCLSYAVCEYGRQVQPGFVMEYVTPAVIWLAWAVVFGYPIVRSLTQHPQSSPATS